MLENITNRPDLYDILYYDFTDDLDMYVNFSKNHKEVLLCGAGTGRTTFPIAKYGIEVFALDISEPMLSLLKKKLIKLPLDVQEKVTIVREDMRSFVLNRTFTCCIVPFSTFNYLLTIYDQERALIAIKKHLIPSGELILELLSANTFPELMNRRGRIKSFERQFEDKKVEMWRTTKFDSATQIVTQEREYISYFLDGKEERNILLWENRFFFLGEIVLLLEKCGFKVKEIYGDYQFGKYRNDSEFIVIKAISIK